MSMPKLHLDRKDGVNLLVKGIVTTERHVTQDEIPLWPRVIPSVQYSHRLAIKLLLVALGPHQLKILYRLS